MQKLKLIIFDWDGTLVDSVSKIIACKKFLAKKFYLPVPQDEIIREVLGTKFEEAMEKCFPQTSSELLNKVGAEFHYLMQQDLYQANLFPDVQKILGLIKQRGLILVIATSKDRLELDSALKHTKLSNMFDLTCCGSEHESKPDPTMLRYIMEQFQVKSEECLMVGDTTTDALFAANAGVKMIGVTFGAHSESKLKSLNPFGLIDRWDQLIDIIKKLS